MWIEVEPTVLHEIKEFIKLKDAQRFAFHQRRMLKDFYVITITAGSNFERKLELLIGSKYRELHGS